MSDSQLTAHQPVYPQEQAATPSSDNAALSQAAIPEIPQAIEIDGKPYTLEQVREAIHGNMKARDYTQKTQALALERQTLQEEREKLEVEKSRVRDELGRFASRDDDDPLSAIAEENPALARVLSPLVKDTQEIKRHMDQQAKEQQTLRARAQLQAEYEGALSQVEGQGRPLFNRDEMRAYMQENGLAPNQVNVAYAALYGGKLGEKYGESQAIQRGATAPAVMGAGQTRVSTPFTGAHDLPGAPDVSQLSWDQVKDLALRDPEIQRGR
jgi:hypothetical protein